MCISYLEIHVQGFLKITEHVNWNKELKELCLIEAGYAFKISYVIFSYKNGPM